MSKLAAAFKALFHNPEVRLALRALLAGGVAFAAKYAVIDPSGGHISFTGASLTAALLAGGIAFAEMFTPLNQLVGLFAAKKQVSK